MIPQCDRRQPAVERPAQVGDGVGERMVEVAVAAVAEAVAGHLDRRAEAAAVEQVRELLRLAVVEQRLGEREAAGVELVAEVVPREVVDAVLEGADL